MLLTPGRVENTLGGESPPAQKLGSDAAGRKRREGTPRPASTFLFATKDDTVVGKGNINFADETLDLNLAPYNKSFTTVSLRTPVDVRGTFKKPNFHLEVGGLAARLGAAVGLGVLFPPAALLPLIDTGLGENNACSKAYAAQRPPGNPEPKSGSTAPPAKAQPQSGGAPTPR